MCDLKITIILKHGLFKITINSLKSYVFKNAHFYLRFENTDIFSMFSNPNFFFFFFFFTIPVILLEISSNQTESKLLVAASLASTRAIMY